MTHFNFITSEQQLLTAYSGDYNLFLVVISITAAIIAAYSAYLFSEQANTPRISWAMRQIWLWGGATSLGGGIWVMHFIGMLAYQLPIEVRYEPITTLISVIPAIAAGLILLNCNNTNNRQKLILKSIALGSCIGLMHYIGMMAMRMDADMMYSPYLFALSIIVAIALASIALYAKQRISSLNRDNEASARSILIASCLMGSTISGMHYTGMAALYITPTFATQDSTTGLSPIILSLIVAIVIGLIFLLLITAFFLNRHFELVSQIKASQNKLQKIFDATVDAIIMINRHGHIISINVTAKMLFGYQQQDLDGKEISLLFDDDSKEYGQQIISKAIANPPPTETEHYELVGLTQAGQSFPINIAINQVELNTGTQFICIIRNITAQKNNEIALRDNMARTAAIIDTVPDGVFTINQFGIVLSINPGAEKIFGYYAGEVEGNNISMLVPSPHREKHDSYLQAYMNGKDEGIIGSVRELKGQHKNGTIFPIELSVNVFYLSNELFITGVVRDISARKQAEQELSQHRDNLQELVEIATTEIKAIVQTAVNAVLTINEHGTIHLFNPAAERIFGWKAEEAIGQNVSILIPDLHTVEHNRYVERYLSSHQARIIGQGREVIAQRKDGSTFPAHIAVGHRELGSEKQLFVEFIADITEQKQAEKELLNAKNNAEQAARTKANFLANMSHEIRTPMNAIIGFSEIILQDPDLNESSKQHLNTILNSGKNLLEIINDILDFSKIEAGKINLESASFHLPNAIRDTLRTLEFKAAEKDLTLEVDIASNTPIRVTGDPTRLRQVIINLIGNAIKFTASGKVGLSIAPTSTNGLLQFNISDTGLGMSPEQVEKVFQAFSQAESSTSRRFGGTGLGTTISKQIVELMGGKIWVDSTLGEGSSFHFTAHLPETTSDAKCLFEDDNAFSCNYQSPRAFNILLAEDIAANATLATLRLEQQGHKITWVKNGRLAVQAYKNSTYDLILMDVQMPELDGLDATKNIRQLEQKNNIHMPIIALTASIMKEDQDLCINAGMDAIIGKPINFDELLSCMEKFVPINKGAARALQPISLAKKTDIDFSPTDNFIEINDGLSTWQDPQLYAESLINFAQDRNNDAQEMSSLLKKGHIEAARTIAHALKGLAGNLSIRPIALQATLIDNLLKDNIIPRALDELSTLAIMLQETNTAINKLHFPEEENEQKQVKLAPELAQELLTNLNLALNELNPDIAEPHIQQLQKYLDMSALSSINTAIKYFDFDSAKVEVKKLARQLSVDIN